MNAATAKPMPDRMSCWRSGEIHGVAPAATATTRSLHREHFFAACFFVDTARKREARGVAAVGPHGRDRHRACVTAAIFSSVAFLESSINELYLECQNAGRTGASSLRWPARTPLAELWPAVEASPMMLRYQLALQSADAERFHERRTPYRDVEHLLRLRDALVHDQPERHDERGRHDRLQRRLRGRFAPNTLLPERARWFPDLCLGSGCAEWALHSVEVFSDDFCVRMSIPKRGGRRVRQGRGPRAPAEHAPWYDAEQRLIPAI